MESPSYRENLELIYRKYPKLILSVHEAAEVLGVDQRTVRKHYPVEKVGGRYQISATTLARSIK